MSVVLTPCLPAAMTTSTAAARVVNPLATSVLTTFEDSYYRRIPYCSTVSIARSARLVLYMHETGLNIWRVLDIPSATMVVDGTDVSTDPDLRVSWESVLEMELNAQTNLVASVLSDDGRWLVVSDLYEAKLFALDKTVGLILCNCRQVPMPPPAHRRDKTKTSPLVNHSVKSPYLPVKLKRILFNRRKLLCFHTRFKQIGHGLSIDIPNPRIRPKRRGTCCPETVRSTRKTILSEWWSASSWIK